MKVKEIMHKGAEYVSPDTSVELLAKKMLDEDVGAIPVRRDGQVVGIVTDRDIVLRGIASGRNLSLLTASDVMSSGVKYCRDNEDVDHAVAVMESGHVRRLPVLNRKDKLVGMLSVGDISGVVPREVTGELMQAVSAHHG
jgi:CBS domain-containing protein